MEVPTMPPESVEDVAASAVTPVTPADIQKTFSSSYIDLISKPLGSRILSSSDEWFAAASNLTTPTPPIRRPGVFTHAGAWYDGWETRRHNPRPFDWVVVRLGVASGRVAGVEIDTAFFDGNHAPEVAVEGCYAPEEDDHNGGGEDKGARNPASEGFTGWETIMHRQECGPSQRHAWRLPQLTEKAYTHVRLLMYPDGGIARFRLYGRAVPVFPADGSAELDLAAAVNGGVAVACSDQHFGVKDNLLLPGRGVDMGDGWETKRTRGPHVDWVLVKLGAPAEVTRIVVDTAHFRGNFPQRVKVLAGMFEDGEALKAAGGEQGWIEVLGEQKTGPDQEHVYGSDVLQEVKGRTYSHLKLVIIPDGGVKRFKVFGSRKT